MTALILITCPASGADCRPHVEADGLFLSGCIAQSQIVAATWAKDHPKRRVQRVICTDSRRVGYYLGRDQA